MSESRNEHYVAPVDENEVVEVDQVRLGERRSNLWLDAWRDLRRRPLFYIALAMVAVVVLASLWPTLFTHVPPNNGCELANSNGGPTEGHILGFTRQGCDVYSRVVWGARTSLSVGLLVTLITAVIGIPMGAFAGFYGGRVDSILSRIGDVFFSVPYFLAAIVVMSVMSAHRNVLTISFAIGGFAWASLARIVRAEVLRVKNLEYVTSSIAVGRSRLSTLFSHVLPNSLTPVIATLTVGLGGAIVAEASLSFLGIGLSSSTMSWGNDISQAQTTIKTAPMALFWPSLALTLTVLAFILLGELIRDALDPKARARR
ncbi:ABC transporter permease [Demequina capsici]|uniref:ABC transporter permease n=1 Tax=Demequina capsici TaxID=3075620 RepID=A0AA96FE77_9MICO|nr:MULTISPECIES: ABC transporter permease [unclassified Demequina]WNM25086.1 ABC transporter permease [Demequina sp. OYTSA14]WNM27992.1 ABC transporter permease [Demequina sp. PMTSA13]